MAPPSVGIEYISMIIYFIGILSGSSQLSKSAVSVEVIEHGVGTQKAGRKEFEDFTRVSVVTLQ